MADKEKNDIQRCSLCYGVFNNLNGFNSPQYNICKSCVEEYARTTIYSDTQLQLSVLLKRMRNILTSGFVTEAMIPPYIKAVKQELNVIETATGNENDFHTDKVISSIKEIRTFLSLYEL